MTTVSKMFIFETGRVLTAREGMRLMGFPVDFYELDGFSDAKLYKMLGNTMSVGPIGVLEACLLSSLSRR